MAEVKISDLTAATTPLAGTETVPIVQGGVTKKVEVSNIGSSTWGSITGTLSSQTDLQTALDAKISAPSFLQSDNATKTLWNNGLNDNTTSTSFGQYALQANLSTGHGNTANGTYSLQANTSGTQNTAVGNNSMSANTSGGSNTAIGSGALLTNISNSQSTAVGADALYNSRANVNTAIGYYAGRAITTGGSNTAIGANALLALTTASSCVGVGQAAGSSFTTSINNVAIGAQTATVVTTGNNNVFVGHAANAAAGQNTTTQAVVIGASAIGRTGCVVLGQGATATNVNQFVVGSSTVNAGAVTTETLATTKTWSVIINGVAQKILLA